MYKVNDLKDNKQQPRFIISAEFMFGDADSYRTFKVEYPAKEFTEDVQKTWHAIEKIYEAEDEFWDKYDIVEVCINDQIIEKAIEENIITEDEKKLLLDEKFINDYSEILHPFDSYYCEATACVGLVFEYVDENGSKHEVEWVD